MYAAKKQSSSNIATLWVIAAIQFLTPFMFSSIGVALPVIGKEFHAAAAQLGLVTMTYTLGMSLFLLPMGRFADIHGRRKIFVAGTLVMTVATLLLPFSPNINLMIFCRLGQGIGGAMITSTSLAILTSVFPPETRGRALGIVLAGVYLGVSSGPLVAGFMVEYLTWRWIFYFGLLIAVLAFFYALFGLRGEWADAKGERFDYMGALLYLPALSLLIVGVLERQEIIKLLESWQLPGDYWIGVAAVGVVGLVFFLVYENRAAQPMLPVRAIIHNRIFLCTNIATLLNYAASFAVSFFFSIYLQVALGASPKNTGLILVAQPLIQTVCSPLVGRLTEHWPARNLATLGMAFCTAGITAASFLTARSNLLAIFPILVLMGLGFGFFATPSNLVIMGSVPQREYGMAASVVATMRTLGMLVSMTITTVLLELYLGARQVGPATAGEFVASQQMAMWVFAGLSLLGMFFVMQRQAKKDKEGEV
ncbi:MAG: MFS transporter [Desulfobulbaceae bacterium]|jgi:EmrB/QacA subfamily drug resistance transporter|nr:MFS transporter [Desulfobulbaceae bacterium]